MLKTGFRGERKRIPTPPPPTPRARGGGSVVTENQKKPPTLHILRSHGAHTQLLLAISEKGKVATEKGANDEGRGTNDEGKTMVR